MLRATKWKTITNVEQLPRAPGCYVLCNGKVTVYVGCTSNLYSRIVYGHGLSVRFHGIVSSRASGERWGDLRGFKLKVRVASRYGEERMAEIRLINKLSPIYNIRGNPEPLPANPERRRFALSLFAVGPRDNSDAAISEWIRDVQLPNTSKRSVSRETSRVADAEQR